MDEAQNRNGTCRVCGSNAGYKRVLRQLDQCPGCGFVTFNRFSESELSKIYDEDYFAGSEYADYVGQQDALRRSMRNHIDQMARYHPQPGSLLEVGCAYGLFLDEARNHFTSVMGVDICKSPTTYAQEKLGLDVYCEDFLSLDFRNQRFDVICLWDTVEHLGAPQAYLQKARELLTNEGTLFLTTGDIGSLNARLKGSNWRQIHPPSHLHYFSRQTIRLMLERIGFRVIGIETTSYYHTAFNILASLRMRGNMAGRVASICLPLLGEKTARRLGFWLNLGDIMFVAARPNAQIIS